MWPPLMEVWYSAFVLYRTNPYCKSTIWANETAILSFHITLTPAQSAFTPNRTMLPFGAVLKQKSKQTLKTMFHQIKWQTRVLSKLTYFRLCVLKLQIEELKILFPAQSERAITHKHYRSLTSSLIKAKDWYLVVKSNKRDATVKWLNEELTPENVNLATCLSCKTQMFVGVVNCHRWETAVW